MARTLSAGFATHIAGNATKLANMVLIDLVDGTSLAFTDHDRVLNYDIGDGAVDYLPDTGVVSSDLASSVGFSADDLEISGPISVVVTRTAIIGGRYDDATVRFFTVNWSNLALGAAKLLQGRVALAEVNGGKFRLTVHSEASRFSQSLGRTITAFCDADFQDARCGFSEAADTVTVTAVTSARSFTTTNAAARSSDYYNKGTVTFTMGAMAGCRPVEIEDWTVGGVVTLWLDAVEAPAIGDALELRRGCDKTRTTCRDTYDNVINFRAFPDVPGTDKVLRYPNQAGE